MTDRLNQESLDVIAAARSSERAPPESRARVHQGLVRKIGVAGLGVALPTAVAAATGTASTFFKFALAVAIVGGAGAITYTRIAPRTTAPLQPVPIVSPVATPKAAAVSPAIELPTVEPVRATVPSRHSVKRLAAPESDLNHLAEETASLVEIREKMRAGLHREALLRLENYQARFPLGLLREESEATLVQIWNEQGDHRQSCRLARAFLKKWPRSPHGVRMRDVCENHPIPRP